MSYEQKTLQAKDNTNNINITETENDYFSIVSRNLFISQLCYKNKKDIISFYKSAKIFELSRRFLKMNVYSQLLMITLS